MVQSDTQTASTPSSQERASIALANVGDYHGEKAAAAYLSGDLDLYCRHITLADRLWSRASSL
jgi:hypothetical protein